MFHIGNNRIQIHCSDGHKICDYGFKLPVIVTILIHINNLAPNLNGRYLILFFRIKNSLNGDQSNHGKLFPGTRDKNVIQAKRDY